MRRGTMREMRRLGTRVVASYAVLLAATEAGAQEPGDTARRALGLDTLVVEVLRTPVSVARAPFAVAVVDDAAIRGGRPGMALNEALAGVPGVQVDNRYNYALGERISIRGFGARAQFGVRGVHVLLDGIPATMPDGQTTLNHVDLGSVARAEVARGPVGALYGNAAGGVIQLTSAPPPDALLAGGWRVTGGADGLLRLQGTVGGRAGDAWYRASVSRLRYDGFREHADADNVIAGATAGLRGETHDVSLAFHLARYDARNPGGLADTAAARDPHQAFAGNKQFHTGEEGRHAQLGARIRQSLGASMLEASAYGLTRSLDNPIPGRIIDLERRAGGTRVSLSSPFRAATWTVGGEAALQRDERLNFVNAGGLRGDVTLSQRERVVSAAAFAQVAAPVGRRVDVLAALRWDRVRFSVRDHLVGETNPDDGGARVMHQWSPSAGISFRPVPTLTLYANAATAFETPTTTELANRPTGAGGFNPDLEPQRTRSYEAGARVSLDDRTRVEVAAYRARIRGALVPFEVPDAPGRQFFRNAGSAVHRGIEASASSRISRGLGVRAAYTLTDARFDEYAVGTAVYDGNRVPGVAPHRLEAAVGWEEGDGPFGWLEGRWASRTQVNDANDAASPAYAVVDARVGWRGARVGRTRTMPFVGISNLLDRAYNASVVINAFGRRYFEPGPGRAVYAGVEVEIGR